MGLFLSGLCLLAQTAPGNPTGGQVTTGTASISNAGTTLNINQGSNKAIISWQTFSINSGETTKFLVPNSSSATLNRVLGGNPSAIYGTLQSNGQLFLVNPSGIVVGAGGRIDTAGFLGSTLSLSDSDFLSGGTLHFQGASGATIDNEGVIHASTGDVYLIANQVVNGGAINAPQGNVGLAAGSDVLLQQAGEQHLFIQPSATSGGTGIANTGTIAAATAELRAAGGNAYALAINNSGGIAASGFKKINGQVYLTADGGDITNSGQISAQNPNGDGGTIVLNGHGTSSTGTVLSSGTLVAAGTAPGSVGGSVQVLGNQVGITGSGVVDVSGDAGGGTALIGGGQHGSDATVPDADQTYVGPSAKITADALTLGNGGTIVLWGNLTTQAYGALTARGGAQGGNGGWIETSAPTLDVRSVPNVSAAHGIGGTWLLDPSDITITDDPNATSVGFSGSPPPPFTVPATGATLSQADLLAGLQNGSVDLDASLGQGGGHGTITWQHASGGTTFDISSLTNAPTLSLEAPGGVVISGINIAALTPNSTGSLNLTINSSSSSGNVQVVGSTLHLNGGSMTAYGTGFKSTTQSTNIGNDDGVYVSGSTLDMGGGTLSLNGTAGYYYNTYSGYQAVSGGVGVAVLSGSTLESSGSGSISLTGKGGINAQITSVDYLTGVEVDGSSLSTRSTGTITLDGTVTQGQATAVVNPNNPNQAQGGSAIGTEITGGSTISSNGTGLISITGDTTGSTASNANLGIYLAGGSSNGSSSSATTTEITAAGGAGINITGTSDEVTNSQANSILQTPETYGLNIDNGVKIMAGLSAPITLMGTGGTDGNTNPSLTDEHSAGIKISADGSNNGNGGTANDVISADTGAISLTGVAGSSPGGVDGISIDSSNGGNASITSTAGSITLNGSIPNQTATQATSSNGDSGVSLSGDPSSSAATTITAQAGSVDITGTVASGTANSKEGGVVISSGSSVTAEGNGGTGATAKGDVTLIGNNTGSTSLALNGGVFVEDGSISASGTTPDALGYSGLTIHGTASEIDGSTGAAFNNGNGNGNSGSLILPPTTAGVAILNGSSLQTTGAATLTLAGNGGDNASSNVTSGSYGVLIYSPVSGTTTSLATGSGLLSISGQGGSSSYAQDGIAIGGPANLGSVSINAGGAFSATSYSNTDIFIAAALSAQSTSLVADAGVQPQISNGLPGPEIDLFNTGTGSFGPLSVTASSATVYQQAPIDLSSVSVSGNFTALTAGNLTQRGSLSAGLFSGAAGGGISLTNPSNSIGSLGPIDENTGVNISSAGTPLSPTPNLSPTFVLGVLGNSYPIDLTQSNVLPTLGLTINTILTSVTTPTSPRQPSIGGGSVSGQMLASVLPVDNQVAPPPPIFGPGFVILDTGNLGGDISYNPHGSTSHIYQQVSTLGGASSGDSDVGPGDVVLVKGGSVSTPHLPPGLAQALQNALGPQVEQDLLDALGH